MERPGVVVDYLDSLILDRSSDEVRVGLALPAGGSLGLARPAALAAAVLATEQVNAAGGVLGRRVALTPIDAGLEPEASAAAVGRLVGAAAIDAVVGFHTSDVHRAVERVTTGRIPYLFTAPHEGGARLPGVALVGPGPREQLSGPLSALCRAGARRWALLGNDYIWPHSVHRSASGLITALGGQVVGSAFVPLGLPDGVRLVDWVAATRADAVLLSLVGRDLARFNRAFAMSPLLGHVVRLSGALEETGLLEIGGDDSGDLFAAMNWYAQAPGCPDDAFELDFLSRYGALHPPIGAYARGCYDGLHLIARLARSGDLSAYASRAGMPTHAPDMPSRRAQLACADGVRLQPV